MNNLAVWKNMFCIYIKEAATKQEFNRSRSLKFSLQQEQELEPELIFQEQDWIRSQTFWTPITSGAQVDIRVCWCAQTNFIWVGNTEFFPLLSSQMPIAYRHATVGSCTNNSS